MSDDTIKSCTLNVIVAPDALARSLIIILAIHGGLDGESHEMSLIGARIT